MHSRLQQCKAYISLAPLKVIGRPLFWAVGTVPCANIQADATCVYMCLLGLGFGLDLTLRMSWLDMWLVTYVDSGTTAVSNRFWHALLLTVQSIEQDLIIVCILNAMVFVSIQAYQAM